MSCEECEEWKDAAQLWREDAKEFEASFRIANAELCRVEAENKELKQTVHVLTARLKLRQRP